MQGHLDTFAVPLTAANVSDDTHDALRQALVAGLFLNAARLQQDGSFRVITSGQEVHLHPSSVLLGTKPRCIVFNEVVLTSRLYARTASVIDAAWLPRLVPRFFATARS
jgi:ATP-dependent RNA helicase DHX8/PRP22